MENVGNRVVTTLAQGFSAGALNCVVTSGAGFPPVNFRVIIDNEIFIVTNKGSGLNVNWTITPAAENTAPADHLAGAKVTHVFTAEALQQMLTENRGPVPITSANLAALIAAGVPANTNLQYRVTDVTPNVIYFWNGSTYDQLGAVVNTSDSTAYPFTKAVVERIRSLCLLSIGTDRTSGTWTQVSTAERNREKVIIRNPLLYIDGTTNIVPMDVGFLTSGNTPTGASPSTATYTINPGEEVLISYDEYRWFVRQGQNTTTYSAQVEVEAWSLI